MHAVVALHRIAKSTDYGNALKDSEAQLIPGSSVPDPTGMVLRKLAASKKVLLKNLSLAGALGCVPCFSLASPLAGLLASHTGEADRKNRAFRIRDSP